MLKYCLFCELENSEQEQVMQGVSQQAGMSGQAQQSQQLLQQGNVVLKMTEVQPMSSVGEFNSVYI